MGGTRGPYKRSKRTREAVLEAALEEAEAVGFQKTTIEGIARRAGLAVGVVYYHFESRAQIIERLMQRFVDERYEIARPGVDVGGDYFDHLETRFRGYLRFVRRHASHIRLFEELRTYRPEIYRRSLEATLSPIRRELRDASERGEIREMDETRTTVVAHLLLGTAYFVDHMVSQLREADDPGDDFVVATYMDIVRRGLAPTAEHRAEETSN